MNSANRQAIEALAAELLGDDSWLTAPFFYHERFLIPLPEGTTTYRTGPWEVVGAYPLLVRSARQINAVRLLCDEFSFAFGLDDLSANITIPVFTSITWQLEAMTDKGPTNQSPTYGAISPPNDLAIDLNNGNGQQVTLTPAADAFRLRVNSVVATAPTPAATRLEVWVTGRLRNIAPLLMALHSMNKRVRLVDSPSPSGLGFTRSLALCR